MNEVIKNKIKCNHKMVENIRKEYAHSILDLFEDLLDEKEIDIPSDDREGDESEARIYGSEYYDLEDKVNTLLDGFKDNVLEAYGIGLKTDLTKEEVIDVMVSEVGYDKLPMNIVVDMVEKGNMCRLYGCILNHDVDDKWSIKYFL